MTTIRVRIDAPAIKVARNAGPNQVVVPASMTWLRHDVVLAMGSALIDPAAAERSPVRLWRSNPPRLTDRMACVSRDPDVSVDVWLNDANGAVVDCFENGQPVAGLLATTDLQLVVPARTGGHTSTSPTPRSDATFNGRVGSARHQLKAGIVGLGRQGAVLALQLLAAGLVDLVVVDADSFDPDGASEDGHPFARGRYGQPKARAAFEILTTMGASVTPVELPIESAEAMAALAGTDVLFSAADTPAAALRSAALARLLHVPCFVLGAGLDAARQEMASVRMLIPGDRCLACLGGVPLDASSDPGEVTSTILAEQASAAVRLLNRLLAGWERASTGCELAERDGMVTSGRISPSGQCEVCQP